MPTALIAQSASQKVFGESEMSLPGIARVETDIIGMAILVVIVRTLSVNVVPIVIRVLDVDAEGFATLMHAIGVDVVLMAIHVLEVDVEGFATLAPDGLSACAKRMLEVSGTTYGRCTRRGTAPGIGSRIARSSSETAGSS